MTPEQKALRVLAHAKGWHILRVRWRSGKRYVDSAWWYELGPRRSVLMLAALKRDATDAEVAAELKRALHERHHWVGLLEHSYVEVTR